MRGLTTLDSDTDVETQYKIYESGFSDWAVKNAVMSNTMKKCLEFKQTEVFFIWVFLLKN